MFHVDLPTDTQATSNLHRITVRLLFIHKTIGCVGMFFETQCKTQKTLTQCDVGCNKCQKQSS